MERRQLSVTVVLAVGAAILVVAPALGVGVGPPAQVNNETTSENGSVGQQVSAFMQATAVDANTTTDSGMWQASVNTSENPNETVTNRTARLKQRLEQIQRQSKRLEQQRDSLPDVAYTARAAALNERLEALRVQINQTERTAERVGVNDSQLAALKRQAGNASGPEMSAVARNISDPRRGPPADAGPPDGTSPGNDTDQSPPGETGPPGDTGPTNQTQPGNETDANPPGETGPPENTGPTNQTQPGNETDANPQDNSNQSGGPEQSNPDDADQQDEAGPPGSDQPGTNPVERRLVAPL